MRLLVAGVGNIFFGDDGFGPEVLRELAATPIPGAKVEDFGIRGLHLAYELVAGYDRAILVDAVSRNGEPGTLYVIEPSPSATGGTPDAHGMDLQTVFNFVRTLGGELPPIMLVGCEPESVEEGIGLSETVSAAAKRAAALVRKLALQSSEPGTDPQVKETAWSVI